METIGTIDVGSGKLLVTDPCYIPDSLDPDGLTFVVENAQNGKWDVSLVYRDEGSWGRRVQAMFVTAPDYTPGRSSESVIGEAAVDSGQMSVMDEAFVSVFEKDADPIFDQIAWETKCKADADAKKLTYHAACYATSSMHGGIVGEDRMAACSSGYGDGCYPVAVWRNADGQATRIMIEFISEDSED